MTYAPSEAAVAALDKELKELLQWAVTVRDLKITLELQPWDIMSGSLTLRRSMPLRAILSTSAAISLSIALCDSLRSLKSSQEKEQQNAAQGDEANADG